MHMYACAHTPNKVCVLWIGPTYRAAIYLSTKTATLHSEVSLNIWVSLLVRGKKRHKTTSFTK